MKKNYLEPMIQVRKIALESMIAISEGGINPDPTHGGFGTKDFAEDIESDLFGNESFGSAEEW